MMTFKKYIKESVIDIARDTLDPTVFSFPSNGQPVLQSAIKSQILKDINGINNIAPVKDFYIIGSILTKRYSDRSDIDINVEIDENDLTVELEQQLLRHVKKLNGNLATGTTHELNYYILKGEYDLKNTDAAYDVINNRWLKIDKTQEEDLDIKNHYDKFVDAVSKMDVMTGELRRDIHDINAYKDLPGNKISKLQSLVKNKLEEIEDDIMALIASRDDVVKMRRLAFDNNSLNGIKNANWLPENIAYKMLSRYHYLDFIKNLDRFLKTDDDGISVDDVKKIKRMGKQLWK